MRRLLKRCAGHLAIEMVTGATSSCCWCCCWILVETMETSRTGGRPPRKRS
ncbi:hypothetical protein PR003_g2060 [Phytophthora rubi]|uniref:Uncharacterized protein n=1 Tax=Phytophthora rubi TaxID=129364 RepID=A0A6A3P6J3_9STRA|nr:hypothetical protein PR002_g3166 [Phytophthora rubi]KAE9049584.1 hypothetical protein PR001_g3179 [Phytophthora rubi]KAE9356946.1 hypothetical protein PR003_g2060 [Phytophthora rubi]